MAPTRGYRRAIVAVAATITAARFSFRQRSAEPKPAPVRTPTVRAQPRQNTTDAPPLKRKKVAVFYNVYAPPRPHNRTCTSSKTWHKDGEPVYGASPPADSRLLAHYMTPPPEPASVKLRRKANNDAGGAFRRWARRRGKGAPRGDSGAIYAAATAARSGVSRTPRAGKFYS